MSQKRILISQPKPEENSPYFEIEKKYNVVFDFKKFFQIEPISGKEFRKEQRIDLNDYTAIIFTSKIAVDHYFRVSKELRFIVPTTMKYFCNNETIAQYLSKYIVYRKRKISFADGTIDDFINNITKSPEEKFLLPISNNHRNNFSNKLRRKKIKITKAIFYKIVNTNIKNVGTNYDIVVIFSPSGIKVLEDNKKTLKENNIKIAAFGTETAKAITKIGLKVNIKAPTTEHPSMTMAIENFLKNEKNK